MTKAPDLAFERALGMSPATLAEFAEEAFRDAEHAAIRIALALRAGTTRDVFADHDDARVAPHFLRERLVERLADRFQCHRALPQ